MLYRQKRRQAGSKDPHSRPMGRRQAIGARGQCWRQWTITKDGPGGIRPRGTWDRQMKGDRRLQNSGEWSQMGPWRTRRLAGGRGSEGVERDCGWRPKRVIWFGIRSERTKRRVSKLASFATPVKARGHQKKWPLRIQAGSIAEVDNHVIRHGLQMGCVERPLTSNWRLPIS